MPPTERQSPSLPGKPQPRTHPSMPSPRTVQHGGLRSILHLPRHCGCSLCVWHIPSPQAFLYLYFHSHAYLPHLLTPGLLLFGCHVIWPCLFNVSKLIHAGVGNQLSVEPGKLQARCSFLSMKGPWFPRFLGVDSDLKTQCSGAWW